MDYLKSKLKALYKVKKSVNLSDFTKIYLNALKNTRCELLGKTGVELDDTKTVFGEDTLQILNSLAQLTPSLKGKSVYNPYARTGLLSYFLLSSKIVKRLILNDINYPFNTAYTNSYYINPAQNIKNLVDASNNKIPNLVNKIEITNNSIKDIKQINADVILTIYNNNSNYKVEQVREELEYLKNKFKKPVYLVNKTVFKY